MSKIEIVHDENELKWFFDNVLPPLKESEVYFFSLSARNKYLTVEEREKYSLGRTEMFEKTIVKEKNWEKFIRAIRRLECDERGYTTKNNQPIPKKTMVCYININPTDTAKALVELNKHMNQILGRAINFISNEAGKSDLLLDVKNISNKIMTLYQQSSGTIHWIDFDFDVPKNKKIPRYLDYTLSSFGVDNFIWVDTKSGYHLLVSKDCLNFNPNDLAKEMELILLDKKVISEKNEKYEIIYNKNKMIPMPGTYQGGYPVRVLA